MDFQQKSSPVVSSFIKTKKRQAARSLQFESLESREMLAVNLLSAPITGFAGTSNTAEIRFDIGTDNGGYSKIDFVVDARDGLDPAQLALYNHSTGASVALSSIVNGTTSSSASAILGAGSYSVYVAADSGSGGFSLNVYHDNAYAHADEALQILVAAAIAEQQSGWANKKDQYNKLLSQYPGFGSNALDGGRVRDLYPQVDVNGDGVVNGTDYEAAVFMSTGTVTTPVITTTPTVINQDTTKPTITASLKNDTGTVGDRITVDTTVTGRITDASGIQLAYYQLDGGAWLALSLDANGYYTIPSQNVSAGSHTVTILATDSVGNQATGSVNFTYPTSVSPSVPSEVVAVEGGSVKISVGDGFRVQSVNGQAISAGQTINLGNNKGTVTLGQDGKLTYTVGTYYNSLPANGQGTCVLNIGSTDLHGRAFSNSVNVKITGVNNLPTLADSTTIQGPSIAEGNSGRIAISTIRSKWNDVDTGTLLAVDSTSLSVSGISYNNTAVRYQANDIKGLLSADANGIVLNAKADFFKALGAGESITITVAYKVFDGYASSGAIGYATFIVTGVDNPSTLTATTSSFTGWTNDMTTPKQSFDPGFTFGDADRKDQSGYVYSVASATDQSGNDVSSSISVNSDDGSFSIDTTKLANRNSDWTITLKIAVRSASGGTVSQTVSVKLNALPRPTGSDSYFVAENESLSKKLSVTSPQNSPYTTSGLKLAADSAPLPNGVSLAEIISIDSSGNIRFVPDGSFDFLTEGQKLNLKFEYTITATAYNLAGTGTFSLEITGKASAAIAPADGLIGRNGQYSATETAGTVDKNPSVSRNDLLTGWSLPESADNYRINPATPAFDAWSGGAENPLSSDVFGTVALDGSGNLVFTPSADIYKILGKNQWIDIKVDYSVQNLHGDAVPGGTVVFRINGTDDPPSITVTQRDHAILSNDGNDSTKTLTPGISANDIDLNDEAGPFIYAISEAILDQTDVSGAIVFHSQDNTISIDTADEAIFGKSGILNIVVQVTSPNGSVGYTTLNVTLNALALPATANELSVTETEDRSITVEPTVPGGSGYTISGLRLADGGQLPDGIDLSDIAWFENNNEFNFRPGSAFEYLAYGDTLTLSLEYSILDTQYGLTGTGTIEITIAGLATPATAPESGEPVGKDGQYHVDESTEGTPEKTVSKEDLLDPWDIPEGIDGYDLVDLGTPTFAGWFDGTASSDNSPFGEANLGTVTTDQQGNLVFTPSDNLYDRLGEGQWVDISIAYSVQNTLDGEAISGGSVVIRIYGTNTDPTLDTTTDSFDWATNTNEETTVFNPGFTAADVDWNNADTFQYGLIDGDGNVVSNLNGFVIDAEKGTISLLKDEASGLIAGTTYTLTVQLTDAHGGTATKEIAIAVYTQANPTASENLELKFSENETAGGDLNHFFVAQDEHAYSLGNISYKGHQTNFGELPNGVDLSGISLTQNENGTFSLEPGNLLDFLAVGDTLTLNFEFTVTDTGFEDCESLIAFSIVFTGVNDSPTWNDAGGQPVKASQSTAIDWRQYVKDADRNAEFSLTAINGQAFDTENRIVTEHGVFHYNAETKELTFTAYYDSLSENGNASFNITLTIVDDRNVPVSGNIAFTVTGTNKAPVVADKQISIGEDYFLEIDLTDPAFGDYVTDVNSGDSLKIYEVQVDGETITLGGATNTITLDNNVVITLSEDGTKLTIDARERTNIPEGMPEHIEIAVTATDQRTENAVSEKAGIWTVVIDTIPPQIADLEIGSTTEDDVHERIGIDLNGQITDANIPERNNGGDWYSIGSPVFSGATLNGVSVELSGVSWEFDPQTGTLGFSGLRDKFNDLAQGDILVLTFTYTVTDKTLKDADGDFLTSQGTITLTIQGVNDAPVITTEGNDVHKLSNSGQETNAEMTIGDQFEFSDPDTTDTGHRWSIDNLQGTKGGQPIAEEDLPTFKISSDGQISLINSNLDLDPGESMVFTFKVVVTDLNNGQSSKSVTVTVFGKEKPIIDVDDLGSGDNVINEDGSGQTTVEIGVTDPAEEFMDPRTDETWYDEPSFAVELAEGCEKYAELLEKAGVENLSDLFKIVKDDETGKYFLEFQGGKNQFAFLKQDEQLVFSVTISVSDGEFKVTETKTIHCTVTGIGDQHATNLTNGTETIWVNELDNDSISFNPGYSTTDPDENDEYEYLLDTDHIPDGFEADNFTVDLQTGDISLRRSIFSTITEDTVIELKINVRSTTDGLVDTVTLKLDLRIAQPPVVTEIEREITESGRVDTDITIAPPEDGATRDPSDWYVIDASATPTVSGQSAGVSISNELLESLLGTIAGGKFQFDPNGALNILGYGESIELKFEFTVTDKKFGTTSLLTVLITVEGQNATPVVDDIGKNIGYGNGDEILLGNVDDWATDADVNDNLTLVSIGGVDVVLDDWFKVGRQGEFYVDSQTGAVKYRSTGSDIETLAHDAEKTFDFVLVFKDDSGDTATDTASGRLNITLKGSNKKPQIIEESTKLDDFEEGDDTIEYSVTDFATDRNEGDMDRMVFHSIHGQTVSAGDTVYLNDGTKIIVGPDARTIKIDTSNRKINMTSGESETHSVSIVLNDGSGAANAKTDPASMLFTILGKNDPPVMEDQEFFIGIGETISPGTKVGTVDLTDIDTPKNSYTFSLEPTGDYSSFMIIPSTGELLYTGTDNLEDLPYNGEKVFTVEVTAKTADGETKTATMTVTVIKKEAPKVVTGQIDANETTTGRQTVGITVTDQTTEGRTGTDWYSVADSVRFAKMVVKNSQGATIETIYSLPYGIEVGIDEDGNFFFDHHVSFDGTGTLDFLAAGEKATLTFEITVTDEQYKVRTIATVTVVVTGENTAPTATDASEGYIPRAGSTTEVKYYAKDLASDTDKRDTLTFSQVNGEAIELGESVNIQDENGLTIGTVTRKSDENGEYLAFVPASDYFAIRHDALKQFLFTYTVSDGTETATGSITQGLYGENRAPEFNEGISLVTDEKTELVIHAEDVATDPNGDPMTIVGVQVGDVQYAADYTGIIELPSGATLRFGEDGTLIYSPVSRRDNLNRTKSETEEFSVIVADDLNRTTSLSSWIPVSVTVSGLNDEPEGDLPDSNVVSGMLGGTVEIKLDDSFRDADGDDLEFYFEKDGFVTELGEKAFIESCSIERREDGTYLVIQFKPAGDYRDDYKFEPQEFVLVVRDKTTDGSTDGSAIIRRTVTVLAESTIRLSVQADKEQVELGDGYTVTVKGWDRINDLLGNPSYSHGLYNVTFGLYFDKGVCEIDPASIASIGNAALHAEDGCIWVEISSEKLEGLVELLSFSVTATGSGAVKFSIGSVTITRNSSTQHVEASQIEKGSVEVVQSAPAQIGGFILSGFSISDPGLNAAFHTSSTGWTSELESRYGNRDDEENQALLDEALADDNLFDTTGYSAGLDTALGGELSGHVFDHDFEEILGE